MKEGKRTLKSQDTDGASCVLRLASCGLWLAACGLSLRRSCFFRDSGNKVIESECCNATELDLGSDRMGSVSGKSGKRMKTAQGSYSRRAHHAGSWYSNSRHDLDEQLSSFLKDAATHTTSSSSSSSSSEPLRGVICPHAGYSYSGPTAAFSYDHLVTEVAGANSLITQILVLHPSHHVYLEGCAISGATQLETPLGNLAVDDDLRQEILQLRSSSADFEIMEQGVDEREHSGEMQYPFIAKALVDCKKMERVKVLPIMCGNISSVQEQVYGELLAPIVARPNVMCVISTDFCHWGSRFQYQPTGSVGSMEIHQHIRELDHQGMRHIELEDPGAFAKYLKQTRNTICGRHAVSVWLSAVHSNNPSREALEISFVKYDQSSQVNSMRGSSVSYASATARRKASG